MSPKKIRTLVLSNLSLSHSVTNYHQVLPWQLKLRKIPSYRLLRTNPCRLVATSIIAISFEEIAAVAVQK